MSENKKSVWSLWKNTGKNTVSKMVGFEAIKDGATYIKTTSKHLLNPKEAIKNARVETFEQAVSRLGVSDEDLKKNHNNFTTTFWVSFVFAMFCLYNIFNYGIGGHLLSALASFSIMLVCLANCFKYSFRAFQIRHRNLCSAKVFLNRFNEWFPTYK